MRVRTSNTRRVFRNNGKPSDFGHRATSLIDQRMEFERRAVELRCAGLKPIEIATEMGLDLLEVSPLLQAGLEEYRVDRDNAIDRMVAVMSARYECILREWWPKAFGRYEKMTEEDEEGVKTEIEVYLPGDPLAAKMVLKIQSDMSKMLGLNKVKVEHTGKDGGAIAATIDITQIPSDLIERFLQTGDRSILTPGFVHALPTRGQSSGGTGEETPRTRKD